MMRRTGLPSLAGKKSSPTWKSLMESPKLWSSSFFVRIGYNHTVRHLMIRCITCHATKSLCTGHCHLRSHLYRLGLSHTPDCPCETAPWTQERILQSCPMHKEARNQFWPLRTTLHEKLWGFQAETTIYVIFSTNIKVWSFSPQTSRSGHFLHKHLGLKSIVNGTQKKKEEEERHNHIHIL